jgi:hypothetical protein
MIKSVIINKHDFLVEENEFNYYKNQEFSNLLLVESLDHQERLISLIKELTMIFDYKIDLSVINCTHGGFIPIKCSDFFQNIYIDNNLNSVNKKNILCNVLKYEIKNISFINNFKELNNPYICLINDENQITNLNFINKNNMPILILPNKINNLNLEYLKYKLTDTDLLICIPSQYHNKFLEEFHYFIKGNNELDYNNLVNYTMIVKNAGYAFENILKENMKYIDRWTILDTGSTDNTIEIINKVLVGKKKGKLYQEPFINFRESRNRCLELAGKTCKYNIMLDDTYVIKGDIRKFLKLARSDQFADSFSLYIKSNDSEYGSNRITKSEAELKYVYKLHEVITPVDNRNVMIPLDVARIYDYRFDYMEKRTMERKKYDLNILHEMEEEEPEDSRSLYYLGQTYSLVKEFEKAYKYFIKRIEHEHDGFNQEKIDACFEAARIANFQLKKPWEDVKKLYEKAYEMDKSRPDSLYFLGINYYLNGDNKKAYEYFKDAFKIGYPEHCQYSLKPTLSYYFLPNYLSRLCYEFNDYDLGLEACNLFLKHNTPDSNGNIKYSDIFNELDYQTVVSYHQIYTCLKQMPPKNYNIIYPKKPYLCFVVDGGFENWTGRDILTKGMGGSETCMVELARYIQRSGYFQVVVFCKCDFNDIFEGVEYRNLSEYYSFINDNYVHTCFISRYSHYTAPAIQGNVENIYMIAHDLTFSGNVILQNKLRKIFCLSEWHVEYLSNFFQTLRPIISPFYYGINFDIFLKHKNLNKIPYKFIYSSFPNRGLLPLLQMWPSILEKYPMATLYIYSNVDGKWVNSVKPEEMEKIRKIIQEYKKNKSIDKSLFYKGWVNKEELAKSWMTSDIWFYPCTFLETFCHTALEAALSKTLAIGRNYGSLKNTIGDRGLLLEGDFYDEKVQKENLIEVFKLLDDEKRKQKLIEDNYNWALNLSWENRANDLLVNYLLPTLPKDMVIEKNINYNSNTLIVESVQNNENLNDDIERLLEYFRLISDKDIKNFKLLSLYTGDGISMLNIFKFFKDDMTVYALDTWNDDTIQKQFYNNIMNFNSDKIQIYKDEYDKTLFNFSYKNKKFNLIYIHTFEDIDSYNYLITSFHMLVNNGFIIINNIKDQELLDKYIKKFDKSIKIIVYNLKNIKVIQKTVYN